MSSYADIEVAELLRDWGKFYLDIFGLEKDFSALAVPPHQASFDHLLVVAERMTPNRLFKACQKLFPCWRYSEDLNLVESNRTADHDYAVWVCDRQEADEELKNLSANNLNDQDVSGITLEERLIYELKFFKETGKHLDVVNWTLCTGSRDSHGDVPSVHWARAHGGMYVVWWGPTHRYEDLRTRAVVSV